LTVDNGASKSLGSNEAICSDHTKIIAEQGSRIVELKNEVEAYERLIEAFQLNVREAHESVQVPQVVSQCHSFM
jgi:hypothetical protein